jgi:hypothetical protein
MTSKAIYGYSSTGFINGMVHLAGGEFRSICSCKISTSKYRCLCTKVISVFPRPQVLTFQHNFSVASQLKRLSAARTINMTVDAAILVGRLLRVGRAVHTNTASDNTALALASAVGTAVIGECVSCSFTRREESGSCCCIDISPKRVDASIFTIVILVAVP